MSPKLQNGTPSSCTTSTSTDRIIRLPKKVPWITKWSLQHHTMRNRCCDDSISQWTSTTEPIYANETKIQVPNKSCGNESVTNSHSLRQNLTTPTKNAIRRPHPSPLINSIRKRTNLHSLPIFALLIILLFQASLVRGNILPQFLLSDGQSEIVLRLKEGPATPVGSLIYTLKGIDRDGDPLTFGLKGQIANELLRIENKGRDTANLYLKKELDREVSLAFCIFLLGNVETAFPSNNYIIFVVKVLF
jgi:hypothetical protein